MIKKREEKNGKGCRKSIRMRWREKVIYKGVRGKKKGKTKGGKWGRNSLSWFLSWLWGLFLFSTLPCYRVITLCMLIVSHKFPPLETPFPPFTLSSPIFPPTPFYILISFHFFFSSSFLFFLPSFLLGVGSLSLPLFSSFVSLGGKISNKMCSSTSTRVVSGRFFFFFFSSCSSSLCLGDVLLLLWASLVAFIFRARLMFVFNSSFLGLYSLLSFYISFLSVMI